MVHGPDRKVEAIASALTAQQFVIMSQLERTRKTRSRYFSEADLGRKKAVWGNGIEVHVILGQLQTSGLVSQVDPAKGLWEATSIGFLVEHHISKQ